MFQCRTFLSQSSKPEPEPALRSAERNALAVGDLAGREAAPIGEHDRLALRLGEHPQRLVVGPDHRHDMPGDHAGHLDAGQHPGVQ